MFAEGDAASLSRIATWGPTSEELALPDATAGGTEAPAGLAVAVVPVVAAVPVVAGAEVLPAAAVVDAPPVVPAALVPGAEAAGAAVADTGLVVAPWLPAVVAEVPAVPLVELVAPGAVVPVLATGAVTAEPVVVVAAAVPA